MKVMKGKNYHSLVENLQYDKEIQVKSLMLTFRVLTVL